MNTNFISLLFRSDVTSDKSSASPGGVFFLGLLHRLVHFMMLQGRDGHLSC